jgi:hypothetical protein
VIEIQLTPAVLIRAEEMYRTAKSSDTLRFRKDKAKGNTSWTGVLGQAVFEQALKDAHLPFRFVDLTTNDYEVCGLKLDVKTKAWSKTPHPSDPVSVFDYISDHQTVDFYAFVHLQLAHGEDRNGPPSATRFQRAWVLGVKDAIAYQEKAEEVKIGDVFESGHVARANSHNLAALHLLPLKALGGTEE